MKSIYKYTFQIDDIITINLPVDAKILSVQVQHNMPCIWCLVTTKPVQAEPRKFRIFGTGHPIEDDFSGKFIGTFQLENGLLVFHLFEL